MQQASASDSPSGTYLASTVWTDYAAMFSDFLVAGPLVSSVMQGPGMTWNLSWAIVNKTDPD